MSPEWTARGYTGSVLAAINVGTVGEPDVKVIVKVCPPGPYVREPMAHRQAKADSNAAFYSAHLVEQVFGAHPASGGGLLMFQEIAGGTLEGVTLLKVPDSDLVHCCETVIRSVLTEWNPAKIRSSEVTVADYLSSELRGTDIKGGSLHALALRAKLLEPEAVWTFDASRDGKPLPNPMRMMSDPALGAQIRFDAVYGPSHGDLHLENVLIPKEYGRLEPQKFRLVDLSTFEAAAPITRDPVTLMLSVIAPIVSRLREDEQAALLDFMLEPWTSSPPRLTAIIASALQTIYRTGNEEIKRMRLSDWHSQFLLSVQASALTFTTFGNIGSRGRWWFLQLAATAGAAFLRRHNAYEPAAAVAMRRPLNLPHSGRVQIEATPAEREDDRSGDMHPVSLQADESRTLTELLAVLPPSLLAAAYHDTIETSIAEPQPTWEDAAAVARAVQRSHTAAGETSALFIYIDRLAHTTKGAIALALHRWLTSVGRRNHLGDDVLRQLCAESEKRPRYQLTIESLPSHDKRLSSSEPAESGGTVTFYPEHSRLPGGSMTTDTALPVGATGAPQTRHRRAIIGNLPAKNPDFTGRDQLLRLLVATLRASSSVSVIPQALHGLGGVGKTQLATEFAYRNLQSYDVVWWISAEDPTRVKASLADLASRLDLPTGQDVKQTIALVLEALSTSSYRWLLVYDNVDLPDHLKDLVPSAGGHVIITSRNNAAWSARGNAIEVDVFERSESIELLQRHGQSINAQDADRLAEKLGDLPLALEQAAIWHATTGMPVPEYLELFDKNVQDLLSEGRPPNYPETIYGILKVAIDQLRTNARAAAELLELFAYLGAEAISVDLLRRGRNAALSEDLGLALQRPIELNRVIRELRRYGLARVETTDGQRIQVHRLLQRVLREDLKQERLAQSRNNAQRLFASANPGYPDEPNTWKVHAEIGPHIHAAELIHAPDENARMVVLDQIRYLFKIGDYEASKALGEAALSEWSPSQDPALGPDQELALIAGRHLANALRVLGETTRSRKLNTETFERLRQSPRFGEDHEHTLYTANSLGVDLRLEGDFKAALAVEEANVERHVRIFGLDDENTWRAQNNLAVSLRHLGNFRRALEIDEAIADQWRRRFSDNDTRTMFAVANHARDLYGIGQYRAALDLQRRTLTSHRDQLGLRHGDVLTATRTITMALRKCGYYADARDSARDNYHDHHAKFGPNHEHTLSAAVSYANALRCCGESGQARTLLRDAVDVYRQVFGPRHALTLAATVNLAITLRAAGDHDEATMLDEQVFVMLSNVLGLDHPYTLCAANGRANSLAFAGQAERAMQLSADTLSRARSVRGEDHPDTLAYAVNAAFDQQAGGDEVGGRSAMETSIAKMREVLGSDHPDTLDAGRGERLETDIEPPPT